MGFDKKLPAQLLTWPKAVLGRATAEGPGGTVSSLGMVLHQGDSSVVGFDRVFPASSFPITSIRCLHEIV